MSSQNAIFFVDSLYMAKRKVNEVTSRKSIYIFVTLLAAT